MANQTPQPAGSTPRPNVLALLGAGAGAGTMSGLFGVGGGIILVPLLSLGLKMSQKRAQATSLAAIVVTAAAGSISYLIGGQVAVMAALIIAIGGMAGSALASEFAHRRSDNQIRVIFALVAWAVAIRMAWPGTDYGESGHIPGFTIGLAAAYLGAGLFMGVVSALVGLGGGIILVPMLVLAFGFGPHVAQGTSLLAMVPIAAVGAWRNATHGYTDFRAGAWVGLCGAVFSPLGTWLALTLSSDWLSRVFALLLAFAATQMLYRAYRTRRAASGPESAGSS